MFTSQSGGGSEVTINNATEVVPRGFMNDRKVPDLYREAESTILDLVQAHYRCTHDVLTEFSSWAASLHAVLFLARHTPPEGNPHVAMLDRDRLDGEVLIFWVPDLLGERKGDIEYLAHGCIRGRGYTAVPFKRLADHRLYTLFPQLRLSTQDESKPIDFGHILRDEMFSATPVDVSDMDIKTAKRLGFLFRGLSVPATVALLCLQPRDSSQYKDTAIRVIQSLGLGEAGCRTLATGYWCQTGAVHTRDTNGSTARRYRDVRQWIKLLRTISSHDFSGTGEKWKRVESDAEYNSGTESDTDIEEYSNRVRRSYDLRSRPTTPTAKKAEADECDLRWLDEEDVGDEGVKEESDEEMIDVEDGDMSKEDMDEEDLIGRLPDGTMQDEDLSDSSDTVMTDETMRPPVGRNYVCVPSLKSRGVGVIVVIMDDYGNVVDRMHYSSWHEN